MSTSATITTKRQLTIPARLFKRANLRVGDKVSLDYRGGAIMLTSARERVRALAGSVRAPKWARHVSADTSIEKGKSAYFRRRQA